MIFHPDLAEKVLTGEKTVTRRRIKQGEVACRYKNGRTYAVQTGRGNPAIGRIRIFQVHRVQLASTTKAEARAEGFRSVPEFKKRWEEMYGFGSYSGHVWRIEFEVAS